jgi:hypothetical protein
LDKNKNKKIDAEDFAILRKEKAKGRGQGLQDEKMKPGKTMKAMGGGMMMTPRGAMGAMGGGMMMKPMGYKAGKSVKVKCKIGRNKPTKMY